MSLDIPAIETERLHLRPPSRRFLGHYDDFYGDADASSEYGGPLSPADAYRRLAYDVGVWHLRGYGVWLLERKSDGAVVGGCGFWQGRDWPRELTWWLLPRARGTGLAIEASRAAIAHAYNQFGWQVVQTYMDDNNAPARKLALRLGGTITARQLFPDGKERNIYDLPKRLIQ